MMWGDNFELHKKSTSSSQADSIPLPTLTEGDDRTLICNDPKKSAEMTNTTTLQCPTFCYVYFSIVAALGSISFGVSAVFSSSFLDDAVRTPNFTQWNEGFENCAYQNLLGPLTPIGAVVGSLLAPLCVSVFGLVVPIVVTGGVFASGWSMIGASWFVLDPSWFRVLVLTGRFVTGFGAGWTAAVSPTYIAEVSPSERSRSRLTVLFSLGIATGTFLSFLIGYFIKYWQLAFISLVFSVAHGVLALTIKESPIRTRNVLANIKSHCGDHRKSQNDGDERGTLWKWFLNKKSILLTLMVISLFFLQQLTGLNAIAFYVGPIFLSAGGDSWTIPPGLVASIAIGIVMIVATIVAFFILDKLGRTVFLFFGAIGMMAGCVGLGTFFTIVLGDSQPEEGSNGSTAGLCFFGLPSPTSSALGSQYSPLAIVSIVIFMASFVIGWSPPLYVYTAEIFPHKLRSLGFGLGFAFNWLSAAVVTSLFPLSVQYIGTAQTFYLLACIDFLTAIFVFCLAPETKNREMGYHFTQDYSIVQNMKEFIHNVSCSCCRSCKWRCND